jgi:hypothetical protein
MDLLSKRHDEGLSDGCVVGSGGCQLLDGRSRSAALSSPIMPGPRSAAAAADRPPGGQWADHGRVLNGILCRDD